MRYAACFISNKIAKPYLYVLHIKSFSYVTSSAKVDVKSEVFALETTPTNLQHKFLKVLTILMLKLFFELIKIRMFSHASLILYCPY